jgi:signal transduction histidine kinase
MFFSGYSGAVAFRPEKAAADAAAPQVSFTGFRLFGAEVKRGPGSPLRQSIVSSPPITLEHWQNFFSVEFAALTYNSPATTRYRYMLEGVDSRWNEVGGALRTASYTSVAPGIHRFRVQCATSRGPWGEPGIMLRIEVLPPWWRTAWFLGISLLASSFAACLLYRVRVLQITRELSLRFEERTAERNRIARDLHDTMLQTIHASMMIVHSIRELPAMPASAFPALEKLSDWLTRATDEARASLKSLRQNEMADMAEELRAVGEQWAAGKAIQVFVSTIGERRVLLPVVHAEVFQIASEAIRNGCKHSQCSEIKVELHYGRNLIIRVRDDGKGIPSDIAFRGTKGHFGLSVMRERAARIGAVLTIRGQANGGTEVELVVPERKLSFSKLALPFLGKVGVSQD